MSGRIAVLPLVLVLVSTACDNPTGVGSELLDVEAGRPAPIDLVPVELGTAAEADITGGSESTQRFLAGVTSDPALGMIRATGHVDFGVPAVEASDAFTSNPVSSATLRLFRSYAYGDTTVALTFRITDLADEWPGAGSRADTAMAMAAEVTTGDAAGDGLFVDIPLPAPWIARWDATLRGDAFSSDFHGFRIEATTGDAVVGFEQLGTSIRAVAGGDTVSFPATRSHTMIEYDDPPTLPADVILMQDGRGIGTVLRFDFKDEAIGTAAVSRARLTVQIDTTLSGVPGYMRPRVTSVDLDAVSIDPPDRLNVATAVVGDDGALVFETDDLLSVIRQAVERDSPLDHFEIRPNPARQGLDVLLLLTGPDRDPRASLTIVPFE